MKAKKPIYLVVVHTKVMQNKKPQIFEQVYVSDNLSTKLSTTSDLIININNKTIYKSRSNFENVGVETVIEHYLTQYKGQIDTFKKKYDRE